MRGIFGSMCRLTWAMTRLGAEAASSGGPAHPLLDDVSLAVAEHLGAGWRRIFQVGDHLGSGLFEALSGESSSSRARLVETWESLDLSATDPVRTADPVPRDLTEKS